jgi:hypothetical protein
MAYAYLLTKKELENIDTSQFEEFYPIGSNFARRYDTKRNQYAVGISGKIIRSNKILFPGFDNPIGCPQKDNYLTHYILSRATDEILGTVVFSWEDNGEYIGVLNNGQEIIRTIGQTSVLTEYELMELEKEDYSPEYYLYPIKMMWLN